MNDISIEICFRIEIMNDWMHYELLIQNYPQKSFDWQWLST